MEKCVIVIQEDYEADTVYMFEYESNTKLHRFINDKIDEIKRYVSEYGEFEPYHSHDKYYITLGEINFRYDERHFIYTWDEYFEKVKINI